MIELISRPDAWAALATLIAMEIVLGIDNLIFISVVTDRLPDHQRGKARRIGIAMALILRLVFLSMLTMLASLTAPVFDLGITGAPGLHGEPTYETAFSLRDLILIAGGAFLIWKSTTEIRHKLDPADAGELLGVRAASTSFAMIILQIVVLDVVFSVDSILTAIGMSDDLPIMITAVVVAVGVMFFAANPVGDFVNRNPTVVMLALAFLLMIGMVLIADGFGRHVPKGYIYAAMGFSAFVELLNMTARRRNSIK